MKTLIDFLIYPCLTNSETSLEEASLTFSDGLTIHLDGDKAAQFIAELTVAAIMFDRIQSANQQKKEEKQTVDTLAAKPIIHLNDLREHIGKEAPPRESKNKDGE